MLPVIVSQNLLVLFLTKKKKKQNKNYRSMPRTNDNELNEEEEEEEEEEKYMGCRPKKGRCTYSTYIDYGLEIYCNVSIFQILT